jgi:hypothetical protein
MPQSLCGNHFSQLSNFRKVPLPEQNNRWPGLGIESTFWLGSYVYRQLSVMEIGSFGAPSSSNWKGAVVWQNVAALNIRRRLKSDWLMKLSASAKLRTKRRPA